MRARKAMTIPKSERAAWDAIAVGAPHLLPVAHAAQKTPRKKPEQKERKSQGAAVTYLRRHLPRGSLVYAIPNMARSPAHRFALIRDGMLPGMTDLCIIVPDHDAQSFRSFYVEWKRAFGPRGGNGGALSDAQIEVQRQLRDAYVPVLAECRSIEECAAWLREQGVEIQ